MPVALAGKFRSSFLAIVNGAITMDIADADAAVSSSRMRGVLLKNKTGEASRCHLRTSSMRFANSRFRRFVKMR